MAGGVLVNRRVRLRTEICLPNGKGEASVPAARLNYVYPIGFAKGDGAVTCYRQYLRVRRPMIFTRA